MDLHKNLQKNPTLATTTYLGKCIKVVKVKRVSLPHYVGVVGLAQLFEEGDLPQDGHGHPVLRQGQLHLLDGHDLVTQRVPGLVDGPVGSWGDNGLLRRRERKGRKQIVRWWWTRREERGGESTRLSLVSSMLRR